MGRMLSDGLIMGRYIIFFLMVVLVPTAGYSQPREPLTISGTIFDASLKEPMMGLISQGLEPDIPHHGVSGSGLYETAQVGYAFVLCHFDAPAAPGTQIFRPSRNAFLPFSLSLTYFSRIRDCFCLFSVL